MTSAEFETAYKKLNSAQKQAVDSLEGPVMVIAGPGTGKTQVLTLRVANILLQTDTPPEVILALTFTESGVRAMRRRLVEIMGERAYRVQITTFHGFARRVIVDFADYFPRIVGSVNVSPIEQLRIVEEVVRGADVKLLRPYGNPLHYVRDIIGAVSMCKRENMRPNLLEKLLGEAEAEFRARGDLFHTKGAHKGKMKSEHVASEKHFVKAREFLTVYRGYEAALRARKLYDFDDMIVEVVQAMEENDDLKLQLQEACQYVLADEHQDANGAQNRLLELLTDFHDSPNLFVVGDEKQAIFRFQGASLENFLYFTRKFPAAQVIHLEDNYRSTQVVLDTAHSLIEKTEAGGMERKKLTAHRDPIHGIEVVQCATQLEEAQYVAGRAKKLIDGGVAPHEIAVLYRNNKDAEILTREMERCGVPYVVESDNDILHDSAIARFVGLLRATRDIGSDDALARAMHADFLALDELDVYRAIAESRSKRKPLADVMKAWGGAVGELYEHLKKWKRVGENSSIGLAIEEIARESGFLAKMIASPNAHELLDKFGVLLGEAEALSASRHDYRLSDFVDHLDSLAEHESSITRPGSARVGSLRLMTSHKSKGLEFDHVFVVGLYDGHWGNRRQFETFRLPMIGAVQGSDDDERRLLYVALTRARMSLVLMYPGQSVAGDELFPSKFLDEIDPTLVARVEIAKDDKVKPEDRFSAPKKEPRSDEKDYLRELFLEQGLSVTALNNYIVCPWRYFYSNLVRIPQAQDKNAAYGTAVHAALRAWVTARANDEAFSADQLVVAFEHAVMRSALSDRDLADALARGRETLPDYYAERVGDVKSSSRAEFQIAGVLYDGRVPLRGVLDRIDHISERDVHVIDYKTSKPKTRNEIMGLTKKADASYWRQLVFYKYLLDRFDGGRMRMVSGEIDFVEPDDKRRFHKEVFDVTEQDTVELETTIARVVSEIEQFAFWDRTCDDKNCEWCALRMK